jgi:hypothetical protein
MVHRAHSSCAPNTIYLSLPVVVGTGCTSGGILFNYLFISTCGCRHWLHWRRSQRPRQQQCPHPSTPAHIPPSDILFIYLFISICGCRHWLHWRRSQCPRRQRSPHPLIFRTQTFYSSIYLSLPVVVGTGCTGSGLSVPGGGGALTRPHPLIFRPQAFYLLLKPLVVLFQQLFAAHLQLQQLFRRL